MKKIKKSIAVFAVVLMMSSGLSANSSLNANAIVSPGCWAFADALETISCGSVGCDFWLWDAIYNACINQE